MGDPKLIESIKASLSRGRSKEEVYRGLLDQGWTVEAIQEGFRSAEAGDAKEDARRKTIRSLVTMGALLVGAGVFSFIAANWEGMTKPVKVAVIVVSMLTVYAAGWHLREKSNLVRSGEALFLLGSLIYGAGIFLVAQMFQVRANWPDGFVVWMLGCLAMAFAVEVFPLWYLAIVLGIVALVGHPFQLLAPWGGRDPFLLTSSFLLLLTTVVSLLAAIAVRRRLPPELREFY